DEILAEYSARNITLNLRALYYQFVSRGLIPNEASEYKRIRSVLNNAAWAGLIDWDHLREGPGNLIRLSNWKDPADAINGTACCFQRDLWSDQANYVELWVQKYAVVGIIENVCNEFDVPCFVCGGHISLSEMW